MTSPTNTTPSSNQPGGFVVGLSTARFLDANLLDESEQTSQSVSPASTIPQATAAPVIPLTSDSTTGPSAAENIDQDDGVPEYMSQLMQRLRSPNSKVSAAPTYSNSTATQSNNASPSLPIEEKVETLLTSEEFVPKKQAPERNTDMSSLRKLANDCTRIALSSFVEKQKKKTKQTTHLYVIGGGLAGAVACFGLYGFVGFLAAIAGIGCLAAAFGGGFVLFREKRKTNKG